MEKVRRYDVGRLGNVERTQQGGVRIPAFLTRTGVLEYFIADGKVRREYRPPEEVSAAASLESLADAPITGFHPYSAVNPMNFREFAVGHITGAPAPVALPTASSRASIKPPRGGFDDEAERLVGRSAPLGRRDASDLHDSDQHP